MKKILAVLLVLAFVLVGCQGNKPSGGDQEPEKKKTFVVGMEVDSAPFNYQLAEPTDTSVAIEGGYADGYDVMMSKAIADKLGLELVIKTQSTTNAIHITHNYNSRFIMHWQPQFHQ